MLDRIEQNFGLADTTKTAREPTLKENACRQKDGYELGFSIEEQEVFSADFMRYRSIRSEIMKERNRNM